jgi:cation transport regulator ChaC
MNRIEFESLTKVINYLKEDEQKNYEECETPDTMHIWNDIKVLMDYAQAHQFTLNNAEEELASERRIDALHQSIHCELYEAELEAELEAKQWNEQILEALKEIINKSTK